MNHSATLVCLESRYLGPRMPRRQAQDSLNGNARLGFALAFPVFVFGGWPVPRARPLAAAEAPEQFELFEKKVRPVLAERCWGCLGPEAQEGDLRLDSPAAALQGGGRGPAWVPGEPAKSLIVSAIFA